LFFFRLFSSFLFSFLGCVVLLETDPWSQSQIENEQDTLAKFPSSAALFLTAEGKALPVGKPPTCLALNFLGTQMVNEDYANMLQTMLNEGWRTFYNGMKEIT